MLILGKFTVIDARSKVLLHTMPARLSGCHLTV